MSMDISSHTDSSVADNLNDLLDPPEDPPESTHEALEPPSVNDLTNEVTKHLTIQDDTKDDSTSSPDTSNKSHQIKIATQSSEKSHEKSATFPSTTLDDNIKSVDPSGLRTLSMPTNLKAVSAMKGSREKRGEAPSVKLRVKWAPDVYDPIPTSVSHAVTNNRSSRHNSKKNSRNKQKNGSKSSRGSKGKDKKVRKRGGNSSSTGYKLHEHEEEDDVVVFHDQLCGSSFLKGYGTNLHLSSVAEAT